MATKEAADDLVPFLDVRIIRTTAPALLCRIGGKNVWLPRWHVSGKLWCIGDRGKLFIRRSVARDRHLTDLIGEYLTELTRVVEGYGGIVFQYTGDGLLAAFLPELAGVASGPLLDRLVHQVCPTLHETFMGLYGRWQAEWKAHGRPEVRIGLGVGLSFGRATIGFLGPAGKKQIGVIGEPVNLAAYLCSQARPQTVLVDCGSFARAGCELPRLKVHRLRSKKPHQRIHAICLRYGRTLPAVAERSAALQIEGPGAQPAS